MVTGTAFCNFVEGLLLHMNKWPLPNSVLIVNNASIHKVNRIHKLVKEHGMCLVFLPVYSPNLNPIKLAFYLQIPDVGVIWTVRAHTVINNSCRVWNASATYLSVSPVAVSIKVWLHANCDNINQLMGDSTVYNAFWQAVYLVTPEKARGWYKHCGYQFWN